MSQHPNHMFTGDEAAVAYAVSASRIWGGDAESLKKNIAVIPVFVSLLFQSLEISIKHAGVQSGLFTESEARSRQMKSGHGVKEIADLAVERLNGKPFEPIVQALTHFNKQQQSRSIIQAMIHGPEFERTRSSYASRHLSYGQVKEGDFALVNDIPSWVESVEQTARNLPKTVEIISRWKASPSKSGPFAIWVNAANE